MHIYSDTRASIKYRRSRRKITPGLIEMTLYIFIFNEVSSVIFFNSGHFWRRLNRLNLSLIRGKMTDSTFNIIFLICSIWVLVEGERVTFPRINRTSIRFYCHQSGKLILNRTSVFVQSKPN